MQFYVYDYSDYSHQISYNSLEGLFQDNDKNSQINRGDRVIVEPNDNSLRNIKLDSRINPRKSIILDISFKDKVYPKTTKHKPVDKINDIEKVSYFGINYLYFKI